MLPVASALQKCEGTMNKSLAGKQQERKTAIYPAHAIACFQTKVDSVECKAGASSLETIAIRALMVSSMISY
jgi:hypothetical protein